MELIKIWEQLPTTPGDIRLHLLVQSGEAPHL